MVELLAGQEVTMVEELAGRRSPRLSYPTVAAAIPDVLW
jgi:hypothetical protein